MKNIREELLQALYSIKDTVEYEQIMVNNAGIPAYAMDDNNCEWWSSEAAHYILEELSDIIEWYASDSHSERSA